MSNGVQISGRGAKTVLFWDGYERTQAELDAVLPGLFEYAQTHPKHAEITPYNLKTEGIFWAGAFVLLVGMAFGMIAWMGGDPALLILVLPISIIGLGFRLALGFEQSVMRPAIVAHDGLFEVYKRGCYQLGPIWSTKLSDIEWRIGTGGRAVSRANVVGGSLRKVVLVRRRCMGLIQKDEFFACGWTPEMMEKWLALLEISSSPISAQAAKSGIHAGSL